MGDSQLTRAGTEQRAVSQLGVQRTALVTGACGFLGYRLAATAASYFDRVVACHRLHAVPSGVRPARVDLCRPESVQALVREVAPNTIFHIAACARPDSCEAAPGLAHRVNVLGTEAVAVAAAQVGARLIYISTDMVFDGMHGMYTEEDRPEPCNVYGHTKLAGEACVKQWTHGSLVIRLSLLYGAGTAAHRSASDVIADTLASGQCVRLCRDEFRTPLHVEDAVAGILRATERLARGTLHLGGPERMSRFEFGCQIASAAGLSSDLVTAIRLKDHPGLAIRPRDCSLLSTRAAADLGFAPRMLRAFKESRP